MKSSYKCFITPVLVLGACTFHSATTSDAPPPPQISLEMPASLAPGAALDVKWSVDGEVPADASVELLLGTPGDPLSASSAGYSYSGSAPARTFGGYIQADGTLSKSEVAVVSPAASGHVSFTLPAAEGDYEILARLQVHGSVVDFASARTWVATTGVRMNVSQQWISPDDPLFITASVSGEEDLRLSAWLVTPDGTTLTLPGSLDNYLPVAEGKIAGDYPLLANAIGKYGNGKYLVSARLETLDGDERGFAGYEVHVCDTRGTYKASGATPGGVVAVYDLNLGRGSSAVVADDGTVSIDVPPGDYLVTGAGLAELAEIACGEPSTRRAAPKTFDPMVNVLIASSINSGRVKPDDASALEDRFAMLATSAGARNNLNILTTDIRATLAGIVATEQGLGADTIKVDVDKLQKSDYELVLSYADAGGSGFTMKATLYDVHTLKAVRSSQTHQAANVVAAFDNLAPIMVSELDLGRTDLSADVEKAFTPRVEIEWDQSVATPGSKITGWVHVSDTSNDEPAVGATVDMEFLYEGQKMGATTQGTTDKSGVMTFSFNVAAMPGNAHSIIAHATITRKSGAKVAAPPAPIIIQPTNAAAKLTKPVLETGGDTSEVTVTSPGAKDSFAVRSSDLLNIVGSAVGKFDFSGVMKFTVQSKTQTGPAKVTVETTNFLLGQRSFAYAYVVNPLVIQAFADPRSDTVNNGYLEIRGTVMLRGQAVRNFPVSFDVVGDGTVEHATRTDTNGVFRGLYRAPATGQGTTQIRIAVVKDARLAEAFVDVAYSPPCSNCPVLLFPGPVANIQRGGTRLISANQLVTWEAQGGTITNEGRFYAPGTGGTSIITAKSVANPANKATVVIEEDCLKQQIFRSFQGTVTIDGPVTAPYSATCTGVAISWHEEGPNRFGISEHKQTCGNPPPNLDGVNNLGFDGMTFQGCSVGFQALDGQGCSSILIMHPDYNTIGTTKWSYEYAQGVAPAGSTMQCPRRYSAHGVIDAL